MNKNKEIYLQEIIVTVIIVTFNDEKTIETTLRQTKEILSKVYPNYEILIVDNNSSDNTFYKITSLFKQISNIRVIRLSKTYSVDIAYTAGLDNCIGDFAILIDTQLVSPREIPLFIDKLLEGCDIVTAIPKKESPSKRYSGSIFLSIYHPIHLLAINRKVINTITKIKRKSRNFIYLNNPIGFSKTTLEYVPIKKEKSQIKSINFIEFILIIIDIIISNSFKPIRFLTAVGMLLSLVFLIYIIVIVVAAVFFNIYFASKNWISIASIIGIMFFLLFSLLTLISEYLIRILDESRDEPLYFIAEEIDKSVININKNKFNVI